jgi:hypothetical protein
MRRFTISLCLAIAAVFFTPALFSQNSEMKPTSAAAACLPSATLEDLTKALDEAVSGPGDKDRSCLRDLLLPEARLTPIRQGQDGGFEPRVLTVEDWIDAVARRGSTPFYEKQVKVISESYGHFAHLWSTYEIRDTPDGKAIVTGVNSVQAVNDGKRWRLLSILWEPDNTGGPLPEKYKQ